MRLCYYASMDTKDIQILINAIDTQYEMLRIENKVMFIENKYKCNKYRENIKKQARLKQMKDTLIELVESECNKSVWE